MDKDQVMHTLASEFPDMDGDQLDAAYSVFRSSAELVRKLFGDRALTKSRVSALVANVRSLIQTCCIANE